VFAFLAVAGTTQLFLGYVESYTFVNCMLALYFLLALRRAGKPTQYNLLLPTVVLLLATSFHLSALIFAPNLLYLWMIALGRNDNSGLNGAYSKAVFGLLVVGAAAMIWMFDNNLLLPLFPSGGRAYTLFSLDNLWDKLNLVTFVLPTALLVLLILLIQIRTVLAHRDNITAFLVLAAASAMVFVAVFDPMLGIRDWDIISITALPLALLGAWLAVKFLPEKPGILLLSALALSSCAHLGTLVSINSIEHRGVTFLKQHIALEPHNGANLQQLGGLLAQKKYFSAATDAFRHVKSEKYRNQADVNLIKILVHTGQPEKVIENDNYLLGMKLQKQEESTLLHYMVIAYDQSGLPEAATEVQLKLLEERLLPDEETKEFWIEQIRIADLRNHYLYKYLHGANDAGTLLFMIRYYSLVFDREGLSGVYLRIYDSQFTADQWQLIIRLAKLSQHQVYNVLLERASQQHGDQVERFRALVED
jgi:hypothetical protein